MSNENLPSYLSAAKPNPMSSRAPWFKTIAPAYAGVMLWIAFWEGIPGGGALTHGVLLPMIAVVVGALLCFALFYWVPGMLGFKTGLPLYIIGSSLFGAKGGIIMPGLFMGVLQFCWVAVNIWLAGDLLAPSLAPVPAWAIMVVWGALATFVGLKGIKYVAAVSTYLPLIPFVILIILVAKTFGGLGSEAAALPEAVAEAKGASLTQFAIFGALAGTIMGFFATAGAAGVDFGTNARNEKDVFLGGFVGVSVAMIFAGCAALLAVAGAYGIPEVAAKLPAIESLQKTSEICVPLFGEKGGNAMKILLALASFPAACFSALIAANSFKAMLPNVNSTISVAIGGICAIILAVTGVAGNLGSVFGFIGASFGPICGAMFVEYFMNGRKWSGPREGVNIAGWAAWALGFVVGNINTFLPGILPMPTLAAFLVGAVVYFICAKAGLQSKLVKYNA